MLCSRTGSFYLRLAFLTYDDFHLPASHTETNLNCETRNIFLIMDCVPRNWATWPECGYHVFERHGMWIWGNFLTFPFDFS